MFGCYGIITCCCKSYHKDTVKFSSNPTISFSRKSTRKDPPVKSDQNKAISVHVLYPSTTEVPPCCQAATKKLTFSTTSVLLLLNVGAYHCPLSRGTVFRRPKNPRRVPSQNNRDFIRAILGRYPLLGFFGRLKTVPLDRDNGTFNSSNTDVVEKVNFLVAA